MRKQWLAFVLYVALIFAMLPTISANEPADWQCGDNAYWSFDRETGTLTVRGSGKMWDWSAENPAPWLNDESNIYEWDIEKIIIEKGISYIGAYAFYRADAKSVIIPDSVKEIGQGAFMCVQFESVVIPGSVKIIGDDAFSGSELKTAIL
ncbi:MAG: leucine-rich repeat domain-containing protein, partial [Clostridia bacterium]